MPSKRARYGQNFLKDSRLAAAIVATSSVRPADTVYEIGPGRGILTAELARVAGKVVAIEKDSGLAEHLERRFARCRNVEIRCGDFLRSALVGPPYKLFGNLPFASLVSHAPSGG